MSGKDDCISRQVAIDALDEQIEQCNKALCSFYISPKDEYAIKVERASLEAYKEQLENMPTAQPERKTGRWIFGFNNQYLEKYYYCSNCGCRKYEEEEPSDYFCSNCGADMRGR